MRAALAVLAAWLLVATPAMADSPHLASLPHPPAHATRARGLVDLGDGDIAYIPASLDLGRPAPLLVLLHGAGGDGLGLVRHFTAEADRRGIVLLGVKSRRYTWDAVIATAARGGPLQLGARAPRPFAEDPPRIDAALGRLFDLVPVDPARIGLAGFSDGASYALAIGTANPRLFGTVIAFSPGLDLAPRGGDARGQRVFISHGRQDPVLPYSVSAGEIADRMRGLGATLVFRPFNGVHEIPDDVAAEALDRFLASPPNDMRAAFTSSPAARLVAPSR